MTPNRVIGRVSADMFGVLGNEGDGSRPLLLGIVICVRAFTCYCLRDF